MIISASYKTDIPAFYGRWFLNRLRAGFCKMVNPFNRHQISVVSLLREDVDGIVFWTKNVGPFLEALREVHERGYPFVVQHTINNYPRVLESRVVDAPQSVQHLKRIASEYGPKVGVWRYDTILFTSLTDLDFHRRNFERLAEELEGATNEVVVSFAQIYKKTLHNTNAAAREHGFAWEDPSPEAKRQLLKELSMMASAKGMTLTVCSQPSLLAEGIPEARCVDAQRIGEVAGRFVNAKLKGGRKECRCYYSIDIGDYDTCPHGCIYCYAVSSRELALTRFRQHDPNGEFLFPMPHIPKSESQGVKQDDKQLGLKFGRDADD